MSDPTSPGAEPVESPAARPPAQTATDVTVPVPTAPVPPGSPAAPDGSAPTALTPPGPAASTYQLPPPGPATPSGYGLAAGVAAYATPVGAGTNGLAIAALVCGIVGFVPLAGVVAIVLGVVALSQLRRRPQLGRGMAVSGVVLGALSTLLWVGLVALGMTYSTGDSETGGSGPAGAASAVHPGDLVHIADLAPGDCFDGMQPGNDVTVDYVTTMDCGTPHDAQIVTIVDLPSGGWPGAERAADLAEQQCSDEASNRMYDPGGSDVDLYYLYPTTAVDWLLDRSATCVVVGRSGPVTGSVLTSG